MSKGGDYRIHTRIAKKMGYNRSCKGKIRYQGERDAVRAANNHNYAYKECDHAVQNYVCPYCLGHHIGRTMNDTFSDKQSRF